MIQVCFLSIQICQRGRCDLPAPGTITGTYGKRRITRWTTTCLHLMPLCKTFKSRTLADLQKTASNK
jgi:hypothetical protein